MTSETPEQNPPPGKDTPPSADALQTVLDNIDALVYVSDFDTWELLYINAYGRRIWGDINGRKCYQMLQGNDSPCTFCTNHLLRNPDGSAAAPHVWEFQNTLDERWYQCRDQAIRWTDGRLVRLEIATDITDRKEMELALKEAHRNARQAAFTDELTTLPNRRAFFRLGEQLLRQARRYDSPLALIMLDLDHFKQINDTHGHGAGDEVLRQFSTLLKDGVRDSDIAARVGGEEFAILLPESTLEDADELASRLLRKTGNTSIRYRGKGIRTSASFGVTAIAREDHSLEDLLHRADHALYRSKDLGRNRISTEAPEELL